MASLTFDGIIKRYDDVQVLHGVDLEVNDGEYLILVGPSGCGKSTLLRCIAGLEEISDGELFVTNLKKFEVNVALVTQNNIGLVVDKTLHLQVSLIFESGLLVLKNDQLPQNGPPLTGLNEAHSIDGRAKFTLKAAPWVTSDKLKRQREDVRRRQNEKAKAEASRLSKRMEQEALRRRQAFASIDR